MKKTISITVDIENYLIAKRKLSNMSSFVNGCFNSLADEPNEDEKGKNLADRIEVARAKLEELEKLKKAEDEAEEKAVWV